MIDFGESKNVIYLINGVKCNACGGDGKSVVDVKHFSSCRYSTPPDNKPLHSDGNTESCEHFIEPNFCGAKNGRK